MIFVDHCFGEGGGERRERRILLLDVLPHLSEIGCLGNGRHRRRRGRSLLVEGQRRSRVHVVDTRRLCSSAINPSGENAASNNCNKIAGVPADQICDSAAAAIKFAYNTRY